MAIPSATLTRTAQVTYTITYGGANNVTLLTGNVTLNKTATANGKVGVTGTGNTSRTVTISSGWVVVTGIVSSESVGAKVVPTIIIRDAADIMPL